MAVLGVFASRRDILKISAATDASSMTRRVSNWDATRQGVS